jgi:hypothetical protein
LHLDKSLIEPERLAGYGDPPPTDASSCERTMNSS